jgi:hypothetical protein
MNDSEIKKILDLVKKGTISVSDALDCLRHLPYENLHFARVDHHRIIRQGVPEIIFAKGKDLKEIKSIAESMLKRSGRFMITKATREVYRSINLLCRRHKVETNFYERAGVITAGETKGKKGMIAVLCAGTSDIPVAGEAAVTASFLGSKVETVYDVGVAGLHRLVEARKVFLRANVLIVVAGMEGALPSVIGGMTDKPIIAVPTSVGYGTSLSGLTALFAMLNSCVPGIAVMNIDNGFGAGVLAHKINTLKSEK